MTPPIPARVAQRAATRAVPVGDCLISTYSTTPQGYAQIGWAEGGEGPWMTTAHRAAWVHYNGRQLEPGETVDHRLADGCTSRRCVRREHLRTLVNLENARRTLARDWPVDGRCIRGHASSYWRAKGPTRKKGYCHACRSELQQRRRNSKRRKTY
jgi:hypothetical protein